MNTIKPLAASFRGSPLSFLASLVGVLACGCGSAFNTTFCNTTLGGCVPVTPGPEAAFVLVRGLNETTQTVQFFITVEKEVLVPDENGDFQIDEDGEFITRPERRTVEVTTQPGGTSRDVGVLFSCDPEPIRKIGLGENLLPTDAAVLVGGTGPGGQGGFGVPAAGLNPLENLTGNFNCGDTVIFRAVIDSSIAGGVGLRAFIQPNSEQPSVFSGPNTFVNYQQFLESQQSSDE